MTPFASDQWVILLLSFLLGLFLGMAFLAGGKWKRRYREEVRRREALEAEYRERSSVKPAAAAAAGAGVGGIIGRMTGRGKHDDLSRIRGIGPNGQERLRERGINSYQDLETLDDRRKAELESHIGVEPGHVDREQWREQARLLREGKHEEHSKLYPER